MHPSEKRQIGYGIFYCDLASRKYINKPIPYDILIIIFDKLKKFKYKHKEDSKNLDYDIISKGAKKKKWKDYPQGKTKFRIKQAFRYGR